MTLQVSGGATAIQSFALPDNPQFGGLLPFVTYTLNFVPTSSAAVTFTLSAGVNPIALDNVQLLAPEPSTWAAVGLGAGLLGIAALRRRPHGA